MSPLFRDPHPTCSRCRGRSYSYKSTCKTCDGWSLDQWEHYRLNELMLGAVNHLPAMLATPLKKLPTLPCHQPPRGPFRLRLPPPPPLVGLGEGREAPSVVDIKEPRVSSPPSVPLQEQGERGTDTQVRGGEGDASATSLALAVGGLGVSAQPQLDTLADKSPPSPSHLRLKISSYHHMDDWGEEGEDRVPSPAPSPPQAKRRRREEREQGTDRVRAPDFQGKSARHRSPTRERPQPRGHERYTAPARPRSPPLRALPAGGSRIHWGLIRPYSEQVEFGEDRPRPLDQSVHPNSVTNSVWQRTEARNCSHAQEPDEPSRSYPHPHHHADTSDRSRPWAPQPHDFAAQPAPTDPYHRAPQPPGLTDQRNHRAS